MNEFKKWALQVGTAILVVVFLACAYSVAHSEGWGGLTIAQSDKSTEACMPVEILKMQAGKDRQFANPRMISEEMTDEAVRLFAFITQGRAGTDYDSALLVEFRAGGGLLFVGHGDAMCSYVIIPADNWYEIVKLLEGERA